MSKLLDGLNDRQREAIEKTLNQSALVLAGAGSGKTSTLTRRIGYLKENAVTMTQVMAVTFTNKAAGEMKERVVQLIGEDDAKKVTLGTFHRICVMMLKRFGERIGVAKTFSIADSADQHEIIKKALTKHYLETSAVVKNGFLSGISDLKNKLVTPTEFFNQMMGTSPQNPQDVTLQKVYEEYESLMRKHNMLDFDDLIMKAVQLLERDPDTRNYYQSRYKYIMVDEYQDTNPAQYRLIMLIAGQAMPLIPQTNNVFLVGDDSQCWEENTLIQTNRGLIPAKDLQQGDMVQTSEVSGITFAEATGVKRIDSAPLVRITTKGGKCITVTPNHRVYATLPNFDKDVYYLYLMYREDKGYRLGLLTGGLQGTIASRAASERPQRLWLLERYESKAEASYVENRLSLKYQIPTLPFMHNGRGLAMPQENMDAIFKEFGSNGATLLDDMGFMFNYPHYVPQGTTKFDTSHRVVNVMTNTKGVNQVAFEYGDVRIRKSKSSYREAIRFAEQISSQHDANFIRERYSFKERTALQLFSANSLLPTMKIPVVENDQIVLDEIVSMEDAGGGPVIDIEVERTGMLIGNNILTHNSIYKFRGSDLSIIMNFQEDFPQARIVKLEQNYRSSKTIVHAGNEVIKNNQQRIDKTLFTEKGNGSKIKIYSAMKADYEAEFIAKEILRLIKKGYKASDIAILYRTNFISRGLEGSFIAARIPYTIVGGLGFYERAEIKDTIAYLKVIANPQDDIAMKRVMEVAPGVGKSTILDVMQEAEEGGTSLSEALKYYQARRTAAQNALDILRETLRELYLIYRVNKQSGTRDPVSKMMEIIWKRTNYKEKLQAKKDKESFGRLENLHELEQIALRYQTETPEPTLDDFMDGVTLQSNKAEEGESNAVSMMSIHASKGLEYPVVFIAAMEENIFPHKNSLHDIEEERRLMYVAVTRAKDDLYITHSNQRSSYGGQEWNMPSRFIEEIPPECIERI